MFDEPTLREILLPSSDNINDYVAYLKEICGTRRKQKKTYRQEEVAQCD